MSRDPLRPNTPSRQPTEGGRLRHQEMREMTTLAGSLLDFILGLFRDPEAAAAFDVNPEKALADAGLSDCTPDDVHALMPMVTDFAPTSGGHHGGNDKDKDEDDRGHHKPDEDSDKGDDKDDDKDDDGKDKDHHGGNGHDVAVIHNSYVENHYNSDVDIDASNSVWAGGDAYAIWGDDTTIATGGSVAGGRDVSHVSASQDNDVDIDVEDSYNDNSTDVRGDGNAVGEGNTVDNSTTDNSTTDNSSTDNSTDVDDIVVGETVTNVEDSENVAVGENNSAGDTEVGDVSLDQSTDVDVDDSFNDYDTDVKVDDSFNNTETETETDVDFQDSFNQDSFNDYNTDIDVQDNEVDLDPTS
jgi:hypothetical protein